MDLAELVLVGWPINGRSVDTLARLDVHGREGQAVTLELELDERPWTIYAVTRDSIGNWTCLSNGLSVGPWTASVPIERAAAMRVRWYDVQGRRVARPTTPGVWWYDSAGVARKIVIVR